MIPIDSKTTCQCGSKNLFLEEDVGWDIDDSGECRQHLQTCKDCGAYRIVGDNIQFDFDKGVYVTERIYGTWIGGNNE